MLRAHARTHATGADGSADLIRANDESDWPGGVQQRFRALRPLVDGLLEGCARVRVRAPVTNDALNTC